MKKIIFILFSFLLFFGCAPSLYYYYRYYPNYDFRNPDKIRDIKVNNINIGIYISNNGLAIKPQDKERIFEMHFTRKTNGRGMGLSISREVLEAEGYSLILDEPREKSTVTFKIFKK